MLNLGRNALQAIAQNADGKGRIMLRTRALTNVNIGARRHRLVASVQFEDNGPGVPDHLRDTLFYPLVTGRADGTGLGLAVAQDLVSRHDGLIEFDSRPGLTPSSRSCCPSMLQISVKPLNVWLVDDDASIRWVLERALRQGGMAPTAFDQADTALAALRRDRPDVLITDIRMPGRSGLELLTRDSRQSAGAAGHRHDGALRSRQRGGRLSGRRVRISAEAVRHRSGRGPGAARRAAAQRVRRSPRSKRGAFPRCSARRRRCRKCFARSAGCRARA